jgi:hypothetical protein
MINVQHIHATLPIKMLTMIENNDENDSYYYSVTAQLAKKFDFGLDFHLHIPALNPKHTAMVSAIR